MTTKREQKLILASFIIGIILFIPCLLLGLSEASKRNEYPLTTVVVQVDEPTNTVTVKDFNGNLWQFKGVRDWEIDDIASCIFDNRGTKYIDDDKIVKVRYSGWLEGWQ